MSEAEDVDALCGLQTQTQKHTLVNKSSLFSRFRIIWQTFTTSHEMTKKEREQKGISHSTTLTCKINTIKIVLSCPQQKKKCKIYMTQLGSVFTYVDLPELSEGGPQRWGNSQHAALYVHQSAHAVIHDYVGRVQVTEKYAAIMEELQALHTHTQL